MAAPSLSVQVNGGNPITGDQLNTYEQTCDTVAQLRGFIGVSGVQTYVRGTSSINDGGQGAFYWNATGVAVDDNGLTTVLPLGSATGSGEWTRLATPIVGVTNGLAAPAGYVGEVIESIVNAGSAVNLTSTAATNVTSITLTPGDWDVFGNVFFQPAGGTTPTALTSSVSSTSAAQATAPAGGYVSSTLTFPVGATQSFPLGFISANLSVSTTYYLVATATFTGSTLAAYGYLGARRRR